MIEFLSAVTPLMLRSNTLIVAPALATVIQGLRGTICLWCIAPPQPSRNDEDYVAAHTPLADTRLAVDFSLLSARSIALGINFIVDPGLWPALRNGGSGA